MSTSASASRFDDQASVNPRFARRSRSRFPAQTARTESDRASVPSARSASATDSTNPAACAECRLPERRAVDAVRARETVEVRPLAAEDLDVVERMLARYPGKHRERLQGQRKRECLYLIAWVGDEPVGHLNLRLRGRKLPDRARRLRAAQIEDLRVSRRTAGAGSAPSSCAGRGGGAGARIPHDRPGRRRRQRSRARAVPPGGLRGIGPRPLRRLVPVYRRGRGRAQAHETCTYLLKSLA